MNSFGRRVLSLLLCICMSLSVLPVAAFADETATDGQIGVDTNTESTGVVAEENEEPAEKTQAEVKALFDALVEEYYRDNEGERWILFESMLAKMSVEDMVAYLDSFGYAMNARNALAEEEKAALEAEYAEKITFFMELAAAINEKAASPVSIAGTRSWFNTDVTSGYYNIISEKHYGLVPGAEEAEIVLNNSDATRRQVVHVFKVDGSKVDILPGYYGIDKDVTLKENQTDSKVTDTAAYYEDVLGYDLVGGMNIALAYDSNAPYSFLVYEGKVLQDYHSEDPLLNQHSGSCQTYLAIYKDGTCELRSKSEPLKGDEWHAVGANFGWLVKDGALVTKTPERTTSPASRSMLGILPDGSLIMCMVDGRGANNSVGLSNYEMGEIMLALGCVNAVNGDGGGSSTFISRREGETNLTMRSVPSDGSERPTLHSVFLAKKKGVEPGIFDHANVEAAYDYYVPATTYTFGVVAIDTTGAEMAMPEGGAWSLSDDSFGTIDANGTFTSNGTLGEVTVCYSVNGTVAQKTIVIANPTVAEFTMGSTVLPYGKSTPLTLNVWADAVGEYPMYFQADSFEWSTTEANAGTLDLQNMVFNGTSDESVKSVVVKAVYKHAQMAELSFVIDFGKGSEILFDFEDGDISDWMGFDEAKQWSIDNGVANTLVGSDPMAGQYSSNVDGYTSLATPENGQVKNGNHALAWTLDNTNADFAGWTYNILFNVADEAVVLRDVANGKNATSLGMWVYIPEGATGLAFQSQLYVKNANGTLSCKQDHFMFTTVSGVRKNLNSCTEADIPQSRWVYASIDISKYDYICMPVATDVSNSRSPSFVRTYVKPMAPAVHTFYIDDITLDYSSAVDDREAPVIGNIMYATADESLKAEGATIAADTVTFSATVADYNKNNAVGLNVETAQIYIDGNKADTKVSGGYMTTEGVKLENGTHVVTFEIADNLGNYTQSSATFTVAYSEKKGLVYVTGHNDSGKLPEVDSVYYIDIKTTDIGSIDNAEVSIKLNSANKWELDYMILAPGFSAVYEILSADNSYSTMATTSDIHSTDNVAVVTITKTGNCELTGEQTLVSLPVRVWSWDGIDSVTGKPITPEEQFATGNCPIVTIDYNVLFGYAETIYGEVVSFNGNDSVETMINDTVNPWHVHEVVALVDKPVTCTENGYTGRTYCYGCASVVDWGTVTAADGHSDEYDYHSGVLACPDCGTAAKITGLVEDNGYTYYAIAGKLQKGWQMVEDSWYYFNPSTYTGYNGTYSQAYFGLTDKLQYTFVQGKLVSGVWVEKEAGVQYFYGPGAYKHSWQIIDGETYYFDDHGYRCTGYCAITANKNDPNAGYQMYLFAEDGKLQETLTSTGILHTETNSYYLKNGFVAKVGLVKVDNDYYYFSTSNGIMYKNGTRYIAADCIDESAAAIPAGTYTFGADGKMIIEEPEEPDVPVEKKNGIVGDYYYVDDVIQKVGLIKVDGAYYYFSTTNGMMYKNGTRTVAQDCILHESVQGMKGGIYTFGADGKMIIEEPEEPDVPVEKKNGIVGDYYYVDDVIQKVGLIKVDGAYYYFSTTNGMMYKNGTRYVAQDCILHESVQGMKGGIYTFGADGKMIIEEPEEPDVPVEKKNGIVGDYYYVDDVIQKVGLIKVDGAYYYFSTTNGMMYKNGTRYVAQDCILHESVQGMKAGIYTFGADGKMVVEEDKNGIVGNYYYENGVIQKVGLIKIEGNYYYFSTTNGMMYKNGTRYVAQDCILHESVQGMKAGTYTFDADGKMVL